MFNRLIPKEKKRIVSEQLVCLTASQRLSESSHVYLSVPDLASHNLIK